MPRCHLCVKRVIGWRVEEGRGDKVTFNLGQGRGCAQIKHFFWLKGTRSLLQLVLTKLGFNKVSSLKKRKESHTTVFFNYIKVLRRNKVKYFVTKTQFTKTYVVILHVFGLLGQGSLAQVRLAWLKIRIAQEPAIYMDVN